MNPKQQKLLTSIAIVGGIAIVCGGAFWYLKQNETKTTNNTTGSSSVTLVDENTQASSASSLNLATTSANIDWSALPSKEVALTNDGLTISEAGTYIVTGSNTNNITINTDGNVRLVLNGVTIKSTTGAAIIVINANNTVLELADGSTNIISDAKTRSDAEIDGTIYSADDLIIQGSGTLSITTNHADGIVSKDDLVINSGNISITSVDDAIRGKDSVQIYGGTINITAPASSFDFDGTGKINGGTIIVNGKRITTIPAQMGGGGGRR